MTVAHCSCGTPPAHTRRYTCNYAASGDNKHRQTGSHLPEVRGAFLGTNKRGRGSFLTASPPYLVTLVSHPVRGETSPIDRGVAVCRRSNKDRAGRDTLWRPSCGRLPHTCSIWQFWDYRKLPPTRPCPSRETVPVTYRLESIAEHGRTPSVWPSPVRRVFGESGLLYYMLAVRSCASEARVLQPGTPTGQTLLYLPPPDRITIMRLGSGFSFSVAQSPASRVP